MRVVNIRTSCWEKRLFFLERKKSTCCEDIQGANILGHTKKSALQQVRKKSR